MVQPRVGNRMHRSAAAGALLAGSLVLGGLAGCSNGAEAGTLDPQSVTGVQLDVGLLLIRNAVLVATDDGGLFVSMTVVNSGPIEDAITDIKVTADTEPVEADLRPRSIALPPRTPTVIPGEDGPTIDVDVEVTAGGYVPV